MRNLNSRIERIEKRVALDENGLTLTELVHCMKLEDPEGFRRDATDPACRDRMMQEVLNSPTPKRVIRRFRRQQLEQLKKVPASPEEKHESPQSAGRPK